MHGYGATLFDSEPCAERRLAVGGGHYNIADPSISRFANPDLRSDLVRAIDGKMLHGYTGPEVDFRSTPEVLA